MLHLVQEAWNIEIETSASAVPLGAGDNSKLTKAQYALKADKGRSSITHDQTYT